jgi:hypothetical protein
MSEVEVTEPTEGIPAEDLAFLATENNSDTEPSTSSVAPPEDKSDVAPKPAASQETQGGEAPRPKMLLAASEDADADTTAENPEDNKPYWPDDWREKLANQISAGDKKAYQRELNRLKRLADPAGVYGMYRELESKFTGGGLIKVPGDDASEEDIANFRKALGVPEKPEDYLKDIKLDNDAVIGDADKPLVNSFADALHKGGATPAAMNAALNWYFQRQEELAAERDQADDDFRRASETALKEHYGAAFQRTRNAITPLFATAPGGTDIRNDESLYARLMAGRMADGSIIGNDPDMVRWLAGLANEVNPAATVTEDGDMSGKSIDKELEELAELRSTNSKKYYSDAVQERERELIAAREKIREKSR